MNTTPSGARACGAPFSQARFAAEAEHAASPDCQYQVLQLTDEGERILQRFSKSIGCDYAAIPKEDRSDWINKNAMPLFCFLCAIVFTFNLKA